MSGHGAPDFERELTDGLARLAYQPRSDLLRRAMSLVDETEQRAGLWASVGGGSAIAWSRVVAIGGVAAVALVAGVLIGSFPWMRQGDPSRTPGTSATPGPTMEPAGWSEPPSYTFVFVSRCGERNLIGRFRATVEDGVVTRFQPLDERAAAFPGSAESIPTLGEMLRRVVDARSEGVAEVLLETDPDDGHPVEISIDWRPLTIDDEECYQIEEFFPAPPEASEYAHWMRADLPDPAPGVFGGGTPSDIVAWDGGYLAVGSVNVDCCADGDPSKNRGVLWTSADGSRWEMVDDLATLEHSTLTGVVTDGSRLLAIGSYAEPMAGEPGIPAPALWVSDDGLEWDRVPDPVPSMVASTRSGFVGASVGFMLTTGDAVTTFMTSTDGTYWRMRSDTYAGLILDIAAAPDGRVVAVGAIDMAALGEPSALDAIVWNSPDGVTWPRPETVATNSRLLSVAYDDGGFVAIGNADGTADEGPIGDTVWSSPDGVTWTQRQIAISGEETLRRVFAVAGGLIVVGDTVAEGNANAMLWVSVDAGTTWARVPEQDAFAGVGNEISSLIRAGDSLLAVGRRWDGDSNHPLPQVWTATP